MGNRIGLDESKNVGIVEWLNGYLSDLHVLYVKLHNLHWNVQGQQFFGIHEKLEEFYDATAEELDAIAERVLTLGHRPFSSMADYLKAAELKEIAAKAFDAKSAAEIVVADFTTLVGKLRNGIEMAQASDDEVTADLLVGALGEYEKSIWMLNAMLA